MERILHIKKELSYDGASIQELHWAKNISDEFVFDWVVFAEGNKQIIEEFFKLGSHIHCYKPCRKFLFAKIHKYIYLIRIIRKEKYRIIHVDTEALTSWGFLLCGLLAGSKVRIIHSHNSKQQGIDGLYRSNVVQSINRRLICLFATDYLACSKAAADWLFGKLTKRKCTIIPNGIDTDAYAFNNVRRSELRQSFGRDDEYIIGHVGRFCDQKNQRFLVDLLYRLNDNNIKTCLLMIGDGEQIGEVKGYVNTLGLNNRVIFTGNIDNVNEYMSAVDIFVLPSLFEGLGIVAVEAQCAGLKCIVSENVPSDIDITENIVHIPLSEINNWIDLISQDMKQDFKNNDRYKGFKRIKESEYDIKKSTMLLEQIYRLSVS